MTIFKNPEVVKFSIIYFILFIITTIIGFTINEICGYLIILIYITLSIIIYIFLRKHYNKLLDLINTVDDILHGDYNFNLFNTQEGDLSILYSQIYKMTVRLSEQAEILNHDKIYLKNSIADISHQLRTPLTSIHLITSNLQSENLDKDTRMELVKDLNFLLVRIDWLISSLLKISKIESGTVKFTRTEINVNELINHSIQPFLILMDIKNQELNIKVNDDTTYIGDFLWSVEAISNIIKNCIEHTQEEGIITIESIKNTIYTEIIISDNGPGLDEKDIIHLFERFYKGKYSNNSNVGIGLALSKMIIKKQNGTIYAKNNQDKGARFIIRFYKGVI